MGQALCMGAAAAENCSVAALAGCGPLRRCGSRPLLPEACVSTLLGGRGCWQAAGARPGWARQPWDAARRGQARSGANPIDTLDEQRMT